ncbi:hypothetical protein HYPSUDRAFT_206784 [Hypholoma sublateritium FD-334 SS-4]|uniref:Extracellular membrane protein CFEM domain-containing protein n=1 Tax=Hypholoma sublateritium (strain FD-334 SS-4) TaxID=945553 RepID=A0A0D2NCG1_HYPSF|nr:hypothetical protein HYPSUDRAFT_206784 [Hypholoma sublateritium FD-334 SS-4]
MRLSVFAILALSSYVTALAILDDTVADNTLRAFDTLDAANDLDPIDNLDIFHNSSAVEDTGFVDDSGDANPEDSVDSHVDTEDSVEGSDDAEDDAVEPIEDLDTVDTPDSVDDTDDVATPNSVDDVDDVSTIDDVASPDPVDDLEEATASEFVDDSTDASEVDAAEDSDDVVYTSHNVSYLATATLIDGSDIISSISSILGNITAQCTTPCDVILAAGTACDDASDATDDEAQCICTDTNVGLLETCLDCIVTATEFTNGTLSTLQTGLAGINAACNSAGYPVSAITFTTTTGTPTSTELSSTGTGASATATVTSPTTQTASPTTTTSSAATKVINYKAGALFALVGSFFGSLFI